MPIIFVGSKVKIVAMRKIGYLILLCCFVFSTQYSFAQNSKIKCYFNHSVNNAFSTGTNAIYLNGTFPDTIAAYINRAKYTIDVAVYNYTSNGTDAVLKIATAINAAYNRGVVVRWVFDSSSSNTGLSYVNANINRIGSPTSSSYGIMHNKFVVIDVNSANANDAFVITGSYNFSVQQTNTDYNNLLIMQDKAVATAYYNEFNKMWGGTGIAPDFAISKFGPYKTTSAAHYFNVNGTQVQVHFSPKDSCGKYLKNVIASANTDLFFGIYTFTDNAIATPILAKFNGGVTVRGIMDNFSNTYTPYTTLSTPLGSNMISYSGAGIYHNKIMIADALNYQSDPQVATGSFNWSTAAQTKNDENFVVIHDSNIVNQYYQSLCKNISDMGGNGCVSPLPIEWLSIEAKQAVTGTVELVWAVNNNRNNDHFEIEKSSDGKRFERIQNITSVATQNQYSYTDNTLVDGYSYYRIKQVDIDGNATYSKIVSSYNRTENTVSIYPNPAKDYLYIKLPLYATEINLYNSMGVKVKSIAITGLNNIRIDIADIIPGIYFTEIITKHNKIITKIFKQ